MLQQWTMSDIQTCRQTVCHFVSIIKKLCAIMAVNLNWNRN